jgi:RNA polymerase sigma factor (TIGR02999 family)
MNLEAEASLPEITRLLSDWGQGERQALEQLIPLVFDDLRRMARRYLRREPEGHTLQPTALVNEVYCRLLDQSRIHWQNREQFFGVAALIMRRILLDHAKGRQAEKRGGKIAKVSIDEARDVAAMRDPDLIALDEALTRLAELDARQSRIVELRYFMGLTIEEIAEVLGLSETTIKREWQIARRWLFREIQDRSF